ncbi:MAG: LysM peptidoglycan-binding domain-containing protein [Dermatophilaceae bacterium]
MSAVTWDEVALTGSPSRMPQRRHLALVPPAPEVAAATTGFRLTRRGRLALTMLVLALVSVVTLLGVRSATATPATAAGVPASTVTVAAGETLSGIAARELPGVADGVARLQIANNLDSSAISAGATLVIPAH